MSCCSESGNKLAGLFSFAADCGSECFHRRHSRRRVTQSEARACAGAWTRRKWWKRYSHLFSLFVSFFLSFPPSLVFRSLLFFSLPPQLSSCLCFSLFLSLFILTLSLRATRHIINLLHSPSSSLLICAVIMLPLRRDVFFFLLLLLHLFFFFDSHCRCI